jgi:hypothetical protein
VVEADGGEQLGLGLPVPPQEPHEKQLLAGVQTELSQQPGGMGAMRTRQLEDLVAQPPALLYRARGIVYRSVRVLSHG